MQGRQWILQGALHRTLRNGLWTRWQLHAAEEEKEEKKMKVKFAGRWYDVLDIKYVGGLERYAIEDEPGHLDWIANPDELIYDEE